MRGHEKHDIIFNRERDFRGNFRRIIYVVAPTGIIWYSTARFILDVRFAFKCCGLHVTPQQQ